MTPEEIKQNKEIMFAQIEDAKYHLKHLREICKHEKTFEGNWEVRVGSIYHATICEYCGECIKLHYAMFSEREPENYNP